MDITRLGQEARRRRSAEIREFLRSRRSRLSPQDVGMPTTSSRRTPGLRREEVAVLAGVGVSWYTWLEQGREINVSADVLDAVARALRLDAVEREHLYLLAGLNPPPALPSDDEVSAELRRVIDGWLPRPAYVIDRHWNLVAVNRAARLVFGYDQGGGNCLVSFFTDPCHRAAVRDWENGARAIVGQFRADAARYPDDPEFGRLAERMRETSPAFAEIWAQHPVGSAGSGVKAMGELVFEYATLPLPDLPGHRLLLYTPVQGTATESRLAALLAPKVVAADPGSADTACPA
nr:helix-turn-helix transcriptional regulator [Kibdelosporangium sp. MJ126-NF4]